MQHWSDVLSAKRVRGAGVDMGILVDAGTRAIVQGITGREGSFHAAACMDYGTNIVAGVTPGRGGQLFRENVPVFDSVEEAVCETQPNASLIFVPPPFAADAIVEAADAGIPLIICVTEGVPVMDMVRVNSYLERKNASLVGPNCPGVINPGARCKLGIMPGSIHQPGRAGVVSRSGTLTYEAVDQLTHEGIGQSSCVGIGGDPIIGSRFVDVLRLFNNDPDTDLVVLIGEIGGSYGTGSGRLHTRVIQQTSMRSCRRRHRPAGQAHGPRWSHHHRQQRDCRQQDRGSEASRGNEIIPTPADIGSTARSVINQL